MTSPKLVLWVTFIQWCSKWFTNIDFLWDARIIHTVYWLLVFIGTRLTVTSSEYAPTTLIKQKSMGIRESLAIPYVHSYSLPKYIFKFVVLTVDRGKKVFFLILTCPPPNYYFSGSAPWCSSFTSYRTISMGTTSMGIHIQKLDKTVLVTSSTTNARLRHLLFINNNKVLCTRLKPVNYQN